MPPSHGLPLLPRMPALKTRTPPVPPLSFMKITRVFSSRPRSFRRASIRPTLSSMFAIMPKYFAVFASGTFPV